MRAKYVKKIIHDKNYKRKKMSSNKTLAYSKILPHHPCCSGTRGTRRVVPSG